MSTLTAIAGDPMDEDRMQSEMQQDPIIELRARLDKFQRELAELRHVIASTVMNESKRYVPPQPKLLVPLEPSNRRLY